MSVRFVRSVWPSASGWFAVVTLWLAFKRATNARQTTFRNDVSWESVELPVVI